MAAEEIIPLSKAYQPYVLELSTADEDASVFGLAICVFLRGSGMLLAVPDGFLEKEALDLGLLAGPEDAIGPSKVVKVPLGVLSDLHSSAGPVASGRSSANVLLVDVTIDLAENMRVFVPDFEQIDILHMFKNGKPDQFPMKEQLLVKATEWVTDPGSGERVNFYSAAEEEVEQDQGDPQEVGPETDTGDAKPKQKKQTVASLAKIVEELAQAIPHISSQLAALEKRSQGQSSSAFTVGATPKSTPAPAPALQDRASLLAQPLSSSIAMTQPVQSTAASLLKEMPPPRVPLKPRASQSGAPPEVEEILETRDAEASSSSDLARAVLAQSNALTALVGQIAQGGDHLSDLSSGSLGFSTKGAAGRARLQQELAMRGTFFVSVLQSMSRRMQPSTSADQTPAELMQKGVFNKVHGTVRRVRSLPGHWKHNVADLFGDGSSPKRQHAGSKRCPVPSPCVSRTNCIGRGQDGHRSPPLSGGGPAGQPVYKSNLGQHQPVTSLCPDSGATMDYHCTVVHQRVRFNQSEAAGSDRQTRSRYPAKSKSTRAKEGSEVGQKAEEGAERRGGRRSVISINNGFQESGEALPQRGDDLTASSISFHKMCASFPRWILLSRTPFAAFLAKSFHIQRCGSTPASVVFPLPLAEIGLFSGSGPKLPCRKWTSLVRRRVLHIVIVALNFLHDGFNPETIKMLGRCPNLAQSRIHRRLEALITTCDSPGEHPLPPGRSGFEFVARLMELEHFAEANSLLQVDSYSGSGDLEIDSKKNSSDSSNNIKTVGHTVGNERSSAKEPSTMNTPTPSSPYSSLNASRLKITGTGQWDLAEFLDDELWLPFLEPKVLKHGKKFPDSDVPNLKRESRSDNLLLARLWDSRGLLKLFPAPPKDELFCRVFNNYKNETQDRMIGDRRFVNHAEYAIRGPSARLPQGYMITSLHCPPGYVLYGAITDRKDFYHQSKVTNERALSNCLPFAFDRDDFADTLALRELAAHDKKPRYSRSLHGDRYGMPQRSVLVGEKVWAGFGSLFQGDHLGVEFALSGHSGLLRKASLLNESSTLTSGSPFPATELVEGLVIDDYFAISREHVSTDPKDATSSEKFQIASDLYRSESVLGSPEKDVVGSCHFKVIGAEVNCSQKARSHGVVSVSAPASKKIALMCLSLRVASLPIISRAVASRLAGNWVSVLMYRRCLTCLLSKLFTYGVTGDDQDEVLALSRECAQELVLSSVLAFVASSDVSVPYLSQVYATDASMRKGAFCHRDVSLDAVRALWLGGDKRGCYTKLDPPFRALRRGLGDLDFNDDDAGEHDEPSFVPSPSVGLDFAFDFVEICGGSGRVSEEACKLGLIVCTPIDLSSSRHFDLTSKSLVDWIFHMIRSGRFKSVMCEPPCTTFSCAAHPCVRSYALPLGFNRKDVKTCLGNCLAFHALAIIWYASIHGIPCMLEQPRLSKMAWLRIWLFLKKYKGFAEAIIASCQFGSPHRKEFRLLCRGLDVDFLTVRCPGGHKHLPIAGSFTKPSAVYVPALARHFAKAFDLALARQRRNEGNAPKILGHESVIINDLLSTGNWKVDAEWFWKYPAHINVLESHSYLALLKNLALKGECRFVAVLDSRVAKGAHAKGRSSARMLLPSLQKSACLQVAGGLYPAYGFAPTRLNTADAPTRDSAIHVRADVSILDQLSLPDVQRLHSIQLSRPVAGWIRLVLVASLVSGANGFRLPVGANGLRFDVAPGFLEPFLLLALSMLSVLVVLFSLAIMWTFYLLSPRAGSDFWRACAPSGSVPFGWPATPKGLPRITQKSLGRQLHGNRSRCPLIVIAVCLVNSSAMPMGPQGAEEHIRAGRRAGSVLIADRVVRFETRSVREALFHAFENWVTENMRESLSALLDAQFVDAEQIAGYLVSYGKELYYAGKPYGRYAETINAVASRRPAIRRSVTSAWDLAFSWLADEPHSHHPALPVSILVAICSLALLWGWPREAALFSLTWTGVLRIGEVLQASRSDLILPGDAAPGVTYALLKVMQPKTRGRAARHQAARVDPQDIVRLLSAVFKKLPPEQKLWGYSPQTLRRRFNLLQKALGLPTERSGRVVPYDLGSLRPGGATFLLQRFEDSELVRRRGRWLSTKVLEIYILTRSPGFNLHAEDDGSYKTTC